MNKIPCVIKTITNSGGVSFVCMEFGAHRLFAMLLGGARDTTQAMGASVAALFKESEVMVCDKDYTKISARNRFVSEVLRVESSEVLARVVFAFEGLEISALISAQAYQELGIEVGKVFGWFVKSSEVMLEYA
ncbi:hypothetical protein BKH46_06870 [Helicobacter sp. 12S02634-8]|nr:hypothetical protein BKH46_06870 [Helicobacter sp. 12S02634-8]